MVFINSMYYVSNIYYLQIVLWYGSGQHYLCVSNLYKTNVLRIK